MSSKERSRLYHAIDGFRAIVHLSLIALHTAMLTTGHLPNNGPLWNSFKKNPIYTFFQAGGTQVDLLFMLSGFLLIDKLLGESFSNRLSDSPFVYLFKRVARLLPMILVVSVLGLALGDTWDICEPPPYVRIGAMSLFIYNYLPSSDYGSFTLSLCWSCCVDLHAGTIFTAITSFFRGSSSSTSSKNASSSTEQSKYLARALWWVFLFLTLIGIVIRAMIFDEDTVNLIKLGEYSNFGVLQSADSFKWIQSYFGHSWKTTLEESVKISGFAKIYLDRMYFPSHTRYSPFAVGGLLACNLFLAQRQESERKINQSARGWYYLFQVFLSWLSTLLSFTFLLIPCLPTSDDPPPAGVALFMTAALRTLSAMAGATLLFRTLVPASHPWHWSGLNAFLSLGIWKPISMLSFCSYLIHFRVIMHLNFDSKLMILVNNLFGLLGEVPLPQSDLEWAYYIPKLFVVATFSSLLISFFLYYLVELPCSKLLLSFFPSSSIKKLE